MANFVYTKACEKFLSQEISWLSDTFKVAALTSDYTASEDTHTSLANIPSTARVGISSALSGKTVTGGVASANSAVFTGIQLNKKIKSLVIFKQNSGVTDETQMPLIAYIDTATGLTDGLLTQNTSLTIDWTGTDFKKIFGKM